MLLCGQFQVFRVRIKINIFDRDYFSIFAMQFFKNWISFSEMSDVSKNSVR